jgi:hypothetical protein
MKTALFLILLIFVAGCAQKVTYQKAANMTPQEIDEAACDLEASKIRDPLFPRNPILNAQAYSEGFDACMRSKGYRADQ